jgi:hypothetical protein
MVEEEDEATKVSTLAVICLVGLMPVPQPAVAQSAIKKRDFPVTPS